MLPVPAHEVPKAQIYVIEVHNHINDALGIDEHIPPQRVVEIMDRTNVKIVVILTGMWGNKLQHVIGEMVKPYPGRFMVLLSWTTVRSTIRISARRWCGWWTILSPGAPAGLNF